MTKVPAIGPGNAKIMIVGESPGKTEVREGRPFVGPAGRELDKFLNSAGLRRDEIFITNSVKHLPEYKEDKDEYFFHTLWKNKSTIISRQPTMAYMNGIVELVAEIKEVNPNVIVPLGNYALWALTQEWGITNWRGSILECTLVPGKKVIPTLHPAWYLYGEDGKAQQHKKLLGNWDFVRVAEQARFAEIIRPKRNFNVRPSPSDIEDAIDRFTDPSLEYIGVDTEWYSPDSLAYIGFGVGSEDIICIPPDSMLAFRAYKAILGSSVPKVWQNSMFDATALYRQGIEVKNIVHDTMVEWFFNWGSVIEQNGLDVICSVLTEQPYYKADVEFVGQDERGMEYCCTDVAVMNEAHEKMQSEEFALTGTKKGYEISMSIINTMIRAAQTGILIDEDLLLKMRAENFEKADELEASVAERVGHNFNARSWQQVQPVVYDELGYGKRFKSRSTAQEELMEIAATLYAEDSDNPNVHVLIDIIRIRQYRNQNSRYDHPGIIDKDGRAKTNWKVMGTKNGRLSATKPWWPGVPQQTVPEDSRVYYIADPGHCFIGWDLGQAEARVVAVKTQDFDLLDDMARGVDIHLKMAAALPFGLSYDQHYKAMKEVMATGLSKDQYKPRFLSKTTRHASNYIQTAFGLQRQINKKFLETMIGVNASMSKLLADGFLDASPGLETWWQWVLDTVNDRRWLENCFGRRRNWHQHVRSKDHEHKDAVAFEPQSTVADLTTLSIVEVDKYEWITPLIHMHDGGLLQVPLSMKDDALEIVRNTMTKEILIDRQGLTIPVDLKWGFNWKDLEVVR